MRLFSRPDGKVDRLDRASWMTPGFDRPFEDTSADGTAAGNQRKWLPRAQPPPRKMFRRVGR